MTFQSYHIVIDDDCLGTDIAPIYSIDPIHDIIDNKPIPTHRLWAYSYRPLKAKFHYAILVADRSQAGRRPAARWNLAYHLAS